VADMVIPFGRYGLFVWPMWSWPIWSVADMVQTLHPVRLVSLLVLVLGTACTERGVGLRTVLP